MVTATRDTRQTIVLAATRLFMKHGYGATSIQQVAEESGISKGNLTYHFPNKQALFAEVNRQATLYLHERVLERSFAEHTDTLEAIDSFTGRLRRYYMDEDGQFVGCLFTNTAIETQHSDPTVARLARQTLSDFKHFLAERLAQGQLTGDIRRDYAPVELAQGFFWMFEGALTLSRVNNDPAEFDAFRQSLRLWLAPPPHPLAEPER